MDRRVQVFPAGELARGARDEVVRIAAEAVHERGAFHVALSGGETPRALYAELASSGVDLSRWTLWFGDERHVPLDHEDSNYRMVRESLLDPAGFPAERTHPFPTDRRAPEAVALYARELEALRETPHGAPRFDLVLLGLGADGHTASLFPSDPGWRERTAWVVAVELPGLEHPRLTLTLPVFDAAREVLFLVAGTAKARRLAEVLRGADGLPAAAVSPVDGRLRFFVDEDAAQGP